MKKIVIIAIFSLVCLVCPKTVQAASAKIDKVWVEITKNGIGLPILIVHSDFNVYDMGFKTGFFSVWIADSNYKWHKVKGNATSTNGVGYYRQYMSPSSNSYKYTNHTQTIFLRDMNLKQGTNKYYAVVCLQDPQGNFIAQSDFIPFQATGGNYGYHAEPSNKSRTKPSTTTSKTNNGKTSNGTNNFTQRFYCTVGYGGNGATWVGEGINNKSILVTIKGNTAHASGTGLLAKGRDFTYVNTNTKGEKLYRSIIKTQYWKDVMDLLIDKNNQHASIKCSLNGTWTSTEYWCSSTKERDRTIAQNRGNIRPGQPKAPTYSGGSSSSSSRNSSSSTTSKEKKQSRYGYYDCKVCYGTGICQTCNGSGIASSYTAGGMNCPNCYGHYTHKRQDWGRCRVCNGTGKRYGVVNNN